MKSIYRLTPHLVERWRMTHRYPTYKLMSGEHAYFKTVEEAEHFMWHTSDYCDYYRTYCFSLSELPLGMGHREGDSLSERIYLADGQIWSVRNYAEFMDGKYSDIIEGRSPDEILFKRGDIIEIFGYGANHHWDVDCVNLAIVVDVPALKEKMTILKEQYLKEDTNHCESDFKFVFDDYDTYIVVPAYLPNDTETYQLGDYCPTHCAMIPHYKVSLRVQERLKTMLERYLSSAPERLLHKL